MDRLVLSGETFIEKDPATNEVYIWIDGMRYCKLVVGKHASGQPYAYLEDD